MPNGLTKEQQKQKEERDACIKVLHETQKFVKGETERALIDRALENKRRWFWGDNNGVSTPSKYVRVLDKDWGEATLERTKETGQIYAVLNMANARFPGGHYKEGIFAQEENIYWRTTCSFHIRPEQVGADGFYTPAMTDLINGENEKVYLDKIYPRVCVRHPGGRDGQGYEFLKNEEFFPFYEMRSAAVNRYREPGHVLPFDEKCMRAKILAQLTTLEENGVYHVILSAFGCGMFGNPPAEVARIYQEELCKKDWGFEDVTFAIAGGDKTNYHVFYKALNGCGLTAETRKDIPSQNVNCLSGELENPRWQNKGASILFFSNKRPKGIQQMLQVLDNMDLLPNKRFEAIQAIARNRLAHKPLFTKRDDEVTQLYQRIVAMNPLNLQKIEPEISSGALLVNM